MLVTYIRVDHFNGGGSVRQGFRHLRRELPDILGREAERLSPRMVRMICDLSADLHHLDERVEQVTEDHSLIAEKIRHGLITEEAAKTHRMRNVITRSLGYQEDVDVDLQVRAVRRGDTYLLCSDGLSGHVAGEEMGQMMTKYGPQTAARALIELACERGGDDNITCVIARVDDVG